MSHLVAAALVTLALSATPARAAASFDYVEATCSARLVLGATEHQAPPATLLDRGLERSGPETHLVGTLDLDDVARLAGGGQNAPPANAVISFILGFIGFGLGHWFAGDPTFINWTLLDVVLVVALVVLDVVLGGVLGWLFSLAVLVERIVEGLSAYNYAIGRPNAGVRLGSSAREDSDSPAMAYAPRFGSGRTLFGFAF